MVEDTYHYDFTTASELEIFVARLEEIIQEWGLHQKQPEEPLKKNDFKTKEWCSATEALTFSDAEFLLVRYHLKCEKSKNLAVSDGSENVEEIAPQAVMDMMSVDNDFFPITIPPSKDSHPIARWYGLRDFVVLIPQHSSYIASESRIKTLLSSLTIAASNTKCQVPIFLQALEPWQCYFLGVFQSGSFHTDFNMVHLKKTPMHSKFLTGLLSMFKTKIGLGMFLNPVTVSVQFMYVLKDWINSPWIQDPPDFDVFGGEILNASELRNLPFGSSYESIKDLYLFAIWPCLLENAVVDGENYSDLDPLQAPIWKIAVVMVDNMSCLLSEYYTEFVILTRTKQSVKELIGNIFGTSSSSVNAADSEITSSLSALTETKSVTFSKLVIGTDKIGKKEGNRQSQQGDSPISSENLILLLYYLFPDADENSKDHYSEMLGGKTSADAASEKKETGCLDKRLKVMKSAPYDGLLWRLSIAMAHIIYSLGGIRSAAYFWYEVTQELRFRWENGIPIQGLEPGVPDSRTCLLNQKLQLLNCCISRRIERDKQARKTSEEESESEGDEDEFYDCDAEVDDDGDISCRKAKQAPPNKPMGRLGKHGDLKLLETGEPLYVPKTQDSVPKTEDQLEEDTQVLLQLGTDALGSELRAKLMSAYLLSDMQAFKAANPGCVLADFLRWCSPRDWIEDEDEDLDEFGQKKGHLSNRMEIPGNMWVEVWQVARPVPAKWQKRLFDDTKESEKVLDFLERKTPNEFIELLLPVMTTCTIQKLLEETSVEFPAISEAMSRLIKKAEILGKMPKIEGSRYEELISDITTIENLLVHLKCLKQNFGGAKNEASPEVMEFIKDLITKGEAEVPGGPKSEVGSTIRHYFSEVAKAEVIPDPGTQLTNEKWNVMSPFPSPHEKEMILRLSTIKGPQRLHAVLKKNECRLCGAFTKNIYFQISGH